MKVINEYISVSDKAINDRAEIYIYGEIVDKKWFDEDVTLSAIQNALKNAGKINTLELHIASEGGSVFAGNPIFDTLDNYKRKNNVRIETHIDGLAASMASNLACVGDIVYAAENSLIMLHRPQLRAFGNTDDLQRGINLLVKAEETLVRNYMRKFNGTEEELKDMLSAETWLTAEEAKKYGLVDEIVEPIEIAASANGITICNQSFSGKVADLIKNKYPNIKVKKEVKNLEFDTQLENHGVDKELFDSLNMDSESIMRIVNAVKSAEKPVEQFVSKDKAIEALGVEDITGEQVLNYAKAGKNMPDIAAIQNKANDYDKIVDCARKQAMASAMKAKGDMFNEARIKKMLDALDYADIIDQTNEWNEEAKLALHAGTRVSVPNSSLSNKKENIRAEDYIV